MTADHREDPAQLPLGEAEGSPLVPATDDIAANALERGEAALERREFVTAAAAFRQALESSPSLTRASVRLAVALDRGGDTAGAMAELDRGLAQHGENFSLLVARASLASARLKYAQAEGDLRRAQKLGESSPEVYLQFGILDCRRARWREALEPLRRAVELDPSLVAPHYYLGEAYNHVDQLDAARASYQRVVDLEPGNWRAYKGLGVVYDRLGRPVEAAAAYRRSRELHKA